ncbi:MAG: acyl-CoA reductase [Candidatus Muiribacteriaceae bacterium]
MIVNKDFQENFDILKKNSIKLRELPFDEIKKVLEKLYHMWKDPEGKWYKEALERLPEYIPFPEKMIKDGLDVIAELVKPQNVLFDLNKSIGDHRYLDRFVYSFDNSVHKRFRPLGVVAHISASNVFISCVDSLISGIVTKNANILKMPRTDRFFPEHFLESIKEADHTGVFSDCIQLWDFRGGDSDVENILKRNCDGIVVWGGEEAVMSYRQGLSMHTRLVEYGPKYSFAVIFDDDRLEEIAENCARDIIMWEQASCSSPHIIFVNTGFAKQFAGMLSEKLAVVSEEYPQKRPDFNEAVEIFKWREAAFMASVTGTDELYSVNGNVSTVVYREDQVFETTPQARNIIVKPFMNEDQVLKNVEGLGRYISTVAIWSDRRHLLQFAEKLSHLGVYKITAPGFMYQGKNGVPHDGGYPLSKLGEFVHVENLSTDRFTEILEFARANTDFYRNFKADDILTRADCFENGPPFSKSMISDDDLNGYIFSSGGTTGKPKYALYSPEDFDIMTDILADIYRAGGIKEGDRVANIFIAGNLWTSFLVANEALKKIGCTNFPIAGNSDFELIDLYLERFSINAIIGLPSIIIRMAEICEEKNINVNIDTILYGGEHFYKGARDYMKKVWGTKKIASAGYALVDTGPVGYQCEHLTGGVHHVCQDYVKFELIDEDKKTINRPGVPGEIIVTNINRFKMPIIRFQTGDMGKLVEMECECGFKGVTFELLGRCDDVIIAGSTNIELHSIDDAVAEIDELSSIWQLYIDTKDKKDIVVLRVEKKSDTAEVDPAVVEQILYRHAKNVQKTKAQGWLDFEVEVLDTGQIERVERTGKVKKVIDVRKVK